MLKISQKLNYFTNVNIFSHFKNKQKMPVVKKPLVSYQLFEEQEFDSEEMIKIIGKQAAKTTSSMLGLSGFFSAISVLSEAKREVETKQKQKSEEISSTPTQCFEKNKETYEDNDDDTSYVYHEKKNLYL